ncbi:MAG: hypothetical protein AAFR88_11325 [Pseudomonadota bacterium]
MDCARLNLTLAFVALAGVVSGALANTSLPLREAAWLSESGLAEALSSEPAFDRAALLDGAAQTSLALQYQSPAALRRDLLAGEMVFRAPLLLGGQAAKAGLTCHSCHVNGRGNPAFQFPAISGADGTADTTHSFFSETLGNDIFDPATIPDLTQNGKIDHDPASRDLERFIATIVIGEFSGESVTEETLRPLTTFVRALRLVPPDDTSLRTPRTLASDLQTARIALSEAEHRIAIGQTQLAQLLVSSAQERLRSIHARLSSDVHEAEQEWLASQSAVLTGARHILAQPGGEQSLASAKLESARMAINKAEQFDWNEALSLYNPTVLADQLGQ